MDIAELKKLMAEDKFHHASYRSHGSLWEGLWIYQKEDALRGFVPAGAFFRDSPELAAATELVRGTGISIGAYGAG